MANKLKKRKIRRPLMWVIITITLVISISSGCQVSYLLQAARGHFQIMASRKPISKVLKKEALSDEERQKLELVLAIREFATDSLNLPDNKSYRYLAKLNRKYPGWNVFAADSLSIQPKTWCYPIAGCVVYHGYFKKKLASRFASKLKKKGMDVYVSPFTGYSTRGIQNDPILNTQLQYDSIRLAGLIFHELAHQQFYYPGSSTVSESFAVTVEQAGVKKWLQSEGHPGQLTAAHEQWGSENQWVQQVLEVRSQLDSIYQTDGSADMKVTQKHRILDQFSQETGIKRELLNNAFFIPYGTYNDLVSEFSALMDSCDGSFNLFYQKIELRFPQKK